MCSNASPMVALQQQRFQVRQLWEHESADGGTHKTHGKSPRGKFRGLLLHCCAPGHACKCDSLI